METAVAVRPASDRRGALADLAPSEVLPAASTVPSARTPRVQRQPAATATTSCHAATSHWLSPFHPVANKVPLDRSPTVCDLSVLVAAGSSSTSSSRSSWTSSPAAPTRSRAAGPNPRPVVGESSDRRASRQLSCQRSDGPTHRRALSDSPSPLSPSPTWLATDTRIDLPPGLTLPGDGIGRAGRGRLRR